MAYWLMKSEPDVYGIDDLAAAPGKTDHWDGVRNYQARNLLRDEIKKGDLVLFYHSNANPPGVAGVAEVVKEGYPDHTQFDPKDPHYDPKSKPEDPRWYMVDVKYKKAFKRYVPLAELRDDPKLDGMPLLQRGQRLSVQPVSAKHFRHVCRLGGIEI